MRTMAFCVLVMSLVGCQSGPRWCQRDRSQRCSSRCADTPLPPSTAQKESRSNPQAARSKNVRGGGTSNDAARSTQMARKGSTSAAKPTSPKSATAQDATVKQLLADLEKAKRDKASLQSKLSEESLKQT
ncbi:MAG TPA: hypothetical protein VK137_01260, partial [Planctomycetaceae bacterium]|nr:hypothetical protein [Planctomycetaceae bacterium]